MIILSADDRRTCLVKSFASLFSVAARETSRAYVLLKCQNHRAGPRVLFLSLIPLLQGLAHVYCSFSGLENGLLRWHMNMHCRLVIAHVQSFPCVEWTNVFTCTSLSLLSRAQLHPLSTAPKTSCMDAFRMSELALESTEGLLIRPMHPDRSSRPEQHLLLENNKVPGRDASVLHRHHVYGTQQTEFDKPGVSIQQNHRQHRHAALIIRRQYSYRCTTEPRASSGNCYSLYSSHSLLPSSARCSSVCAESKVVRFHGRHQGQSLR